MQRKNIVRKWELDQIFDDFCGIVYEVDEWHIKRVVRLVIPFAKTDLWKRADKIAIDASEPSGINASHTFILSGPARTATKHVPKFDRNTQIAVNDTPQRFDLIDRLGPKQLLGSLAERRNDWSCRRAFGIFHRIRNNCAREVF